MNRVYILALFSLLALTACAPDRAPAPKGIIPETPYLTRDEESHGRRMLHLLERRYPTSRDSKKNQRLKTLVDRITVRGTPSGSVWNVYLLEDSRIIDAKATRGNYLFVWSGLLYALRNDTDLASVLAHEIAHTLLEHDKLTPEEEFEDLLGDAGRTTAREIIGSQGAGNVYTGLSGWAVRQGYSALRSKSVDVDLEKEADHVALLMLTKAGFDPALYIEFWEKTNKRRGSKFLTRHQPSRARLKDMRDYLPVLQRTTPIARPTSPTSVAPTFPVQSLKNSERQISATSTSVFNRPTASSEVQHHLRKGDIVQVESERAGWIEISTPHRGFIRSSAVKN